MKTEPCNKPYNTTEYQSNYQVGLKVRTSLQSGKALGDCCAGLIHFTGLDRFAKLYTEITGKDCGCKERQKWLNQQMPNFI